MTKRIHPAQSARKLVGVASGVALVGIVTGFQLGANAQESQQVPVATETSSPTSSTTEPVAPTAAPEAVPAPAAPAAPAENSTPVQQQAPADVVPVEAPAPAPAAPAPAAPVAPAPAAPAAPTVNGTTGGSG